MHVVSVVPKCQRIFWIIALCFILRILKIYKAQSHSSSDKMQVLAIVHMLETNISVVCYIEGFFHLDECIIGNVGSHPLNNYESLRNC